MLVTTLYRLAGEPEVTEPTTFQDVSEGRYFSDAIAWAEDVGIAKGHHGKALCPGPCHHPGAGRHLPVPVCHRVPEASPRR